MRAMQEDMNFVSVLEHHANRTPDKVLATFEGEVTTYAEMLKRTRAFAAGLTTLGVRRGDVVGLLAYNSVAFLEVIFTANYLGAIAMPINWRLTPDEVGNILENSGARVLVSEQELIDVAEQAGAGERGVIRRVSIDAADVPGWVSIAELHRSTSVRPRAPVEGDDPHRLMYTSGTTSRPKGVIVSHANLMWKNIAHVIEFGVTPDDVGLISGPLYHVGALDLTATTMLYAGASLIIHRRFDAQAVVKEVAKGTITNIWLAPAMINSILNLPGVEQHDLSSVRFIIDGGEKMPEPLIKRLQQVFPSAWFADAYGLTETVSGDTFLDKAHTLTKLGSVGKPCLHLEIQIWNESREALPPGEPGEIVLRGPKVFRGYWQDPEATEDAFRGGWFHTGDIGHLDEEGYLYIVDRLKDVIISGGENIASSEVERVLYEHPAVLEAAVIARPDARWGEVPIAYVAIKEGEDTSPVAIREHCSRHLAKFKTPKDVLFVDALPRNPSGKVLKRVLRSWDREAAASAAGSE